MIDNEIDKFVKNNNFVSITRSESQQISITTLVVIILKDLLFNIKDREKCGNLMLINFYKKDIITIGSEKNRAK